MRTARPKSNGAPIRSTSSLAPGSRSRARDRSMPTSFDRL